MRARWGRRQSPQDECCASMLCLKRRVMEGDCKRMRELDVDKPS